MQYKRLEVPAGCSVWGRYTHSVDHAVTAKHMSVHARSRFSTFVTNETLQYVAILIIASCNLWRYRLVNITAESDLSHDHNLHPGVTNNFPQIISSIYVPPMQLLYIIVTAHLSVSSSHQ